jgi:hypothetical protein
MAHLRTILSMIAIIGFIYVLLVYTEIVLTIIIIIFLTILIVGVYMELYEHFK